MAYEPGGPIEGPLSYRVPAGMRVVPLRRAVAHRVRSLSIAIQGREDQQAEMTEIARQCWKDHVEAFTKPIRLSFTIPDGEQRPTPPESA